MPNPKAIRAVYRQTGNRLLFMRMKTPGIRIPKTRNRFILKKIIRKNQSNTDYQFTEGLIMDIFISYRRDTGTELAHNIFQHLDKKGIHSRQEGGFLFADDSYIPDSAPDKSQIHS